MVMAAEDDDAPLFCDFQIYVCYLKKGERNPD